MATDVSSVIKHFPKPQAGFSTTTSGSIAAGATTIGLNSVGSYANGDVVVLVIEPGVENKEQTFTGTVDTGGLQITGVIWTRNDNVAHSAGVTVVDYESATAWQMISKGILVEHNQDGSHGAITATSLTVAGPLVSQGQNDGWSQLTDTWTYTSWTASTRTGVITIPSDGATRYSAGMRIRISNSGTQYGIITKVLSTSLTVYFGTDYSLTNTTISSPSYSPHKAPYGFPLDPAIWTVTATDTSSRTQSSPVAGTWYNLGTVSIAIPIGVWDVIYQVMGFQNNGTTENITQITLSTANNSESDTGFTAQIDGSGLTVLGVMLHISKYLNLATATTYYLNTKAVNASATAIANKNNENPLFIRAVCAYL